MFAHATRRTTVAAPKSATRIGRATPISSLASGVIETVTCLLESGYADARRAETASMSAVAAARVTPGFRRPTTRSQ